MKLNIFKTTFLLAIIGIIISSCSKNDSKISNTNNIIKFNLLDIKFNRNNGDKHWDLTSPSANYDEKNKRIRAINPHITIYKDNIPLYKIKANNLVVINDGEYVNFEGSVVLQKLNQQKLEILSEVMTWNTNNESITIPTNSEVHSTKTIIKSKYAEYSYINELIKFKQRTEIDFYDTNFGNLANKQIIMSGQNSEWSPKNGNITSMGPIDGQIIDLKSNRNFHVTGNYLSGNTITNTFNISSCHVIQENYINTTSDKCTIFINKIISEDYNLNKQKQINYIQSNSVSFDSFNVPVKTIIKLD